MQVPAARREFKRKRWRKSESAPDCMSCLYRAGSRLPAASHSRAIGTLSQLPLVFPPYPPPGHHNQILVVEDFWGQGPHSATRPSGCWQAQASNQDFADPGALRWYFWSMSKPCLHGNCREKYQGLFTGPGTWPTPLIHSWISSVDVFPQSQSLEDLGP